MVKGKYVYLQNWEDLLIIEFSILFIDAQSFKTIFNSSSDIN